MRLAARSGKIVTYVIFTGTGMACALPGVLLPSLIARSHLNYFDAGRVLFIFWIGNAIGALTVRGRLSQMLTIGCALCGTGTAGLAIGGGHIVSACCLTYGIGLGITITAINLIRQRACPDRRAVELVRLNLVWAIGACAAPAIGIHTLATGRSLALLSLVSAFFFTGAIWANTMGRDDMSLASGCGLTLDSWRLLANVPLPLILLTIAAPGMDAASGSWLATYAEATGHGLSVTVGAPTCMWAGLLLSRLIGGAPRMEMHLNRASGLLLGISLCASLLMVIHPTGILLLSSAFLIGFSLGPLYPIFLAKVMAIEEAGPIFFLTGVSASIVPWATGAVARYSHSLRLGMGCIVVIAAGAFVLDLKGERPSLVRRTEV